MRRLTVLLSLLMFSGMCVATTHTQLTITIHNTAKPQNKLGTITAKDTRYGLLLTPHLSSLPPGLHGFHVHALPNCENGGIAAGGHLDPQHTNKHLGPYERGHPGDLPPLWVDKDGNATLPVLAPRLREQDILQRALIIHAGGDNYQDTPAPLGGGGKRIGCGVVR